MLGDRAVGAPRRRGAVWLLATAELTIVMDVSIVNVALPSIAADLSLGPSMLSWVVNAYALAFGGFLLLGGRLADVIGARRCLVAGVVVFTLASIAGATASDAAWLIGARGAQGFGAAVMSPSALALLANLHVDSADRSRAIAVWAAAASAGGPVGAVVGGAVTEWLGWRSVLAITVPIGVGVATLARTTLPADRPGPPDIRSFDALGAVTVTGGLTLLVFSLIAISERGAATGSEMIPLVLSAILLGLFVRVERRARRPLVPREIRVPALATTNAVALVGSLTIYGSFFYLTLYLQQVLGYSAAETGVAFVPCGLATVAGARVAGPLVIRHGARSVLVVGLTLLATSLLLLARIDVDGRYVTDVLLPAVLMEVALGLSFVALVAAVMNAVPRGLSGLAGGLFTTSQQIGGAFGLALLVVVYNVAYSPGSERSNAMVAALRPTFLVAAITAGAGALLAIALIGSRGSDQRGALSRGSVNRRMRGVRIGLDSPADMSSPRAATHQHAFRQCSRLQEALWLSEQAFDIGSANNLPLAVPLHGPLDLEALRKALLAVKRHQPALRTQFVEQGGRLVRVELDPAEIASPALAVEDVGDDLDEVIASRSSSSVELLEEEPFRTAVLRVHDEHHVLLIVFHHCVFDGVSKDIFLRTLADSYNARFEGSPAVLPRASDYTRFVELERERIEALTADARRYWQPTLAGLEDALPFPTSAHPVSTARGRGGAIRFDFDQALTERLRTLAKRHGVSTFVALLSAVQTLQYRYADAGDGDVATALPMDTRSESMRETIGMFVNEAPYIGRLSDALSFSDLLTATASRTRELFALRLFPFAEARTRHLPERDRRSVGPQVSVSYRRSHGSAPRMHGLDGIPDLLLPNFGTRWAAGFRFVKEKTRISGCLDFDPAILHPAAAERLLGHLRTVLDSVANAPETELVQIPLMPGDERQRVLERWNGTSVAHDPSLLPQMFHAQVRRTPDAPAVTSEGQSITYRQLDDRADRLAWHLRELGAAPGTLIGVYLERGVELLVALLATLKSGAAYVPLDPRFPEARIAFMLEDSAVPLLLTDGEVCSHLPPNNAQVIRVDDGHWLDAEAPRSGQARVVGPDDLAYVIYTSGSTGRPKGVMVPHAALANFLCSMAREPGMVESDVLLAVTTLSFDIAALEIFLPLVVGAQVVLTSSETASDGAALVSALSESRATIMQATPSTWRLLVAANWQGGQAVLCGGEALPADLAHRLVERSDRVWNLYGPTETTIWSTVSRVDDPGRVDIGRPIDNTRVYILGRVSQPRPLGLPGELFIGGLGLAAGYLRRDELTADRFVPTPFGRLYRTGDLVRYLDDGRLEYLGRLDHQVKIRGHRIEPQEIEATLLRHNAVERAFVVVREDVPNDKRLVAYVVVSDGESVASGELRIHLGQWLPGHMIPSAFVEIDQLPLTPNGKLDRARLPAPDPRAEIADRPVAPSTPTEQALTSIFRDVLDIHDLGVDDDFFALGGHSLLAALLVSRIREELDMEIPLRTVFRNATVRDLAATVQSQPD